MGSEMCIRDSGRVVPENFLDVLRPFDAILLGAVGWPAELPDHVTVSYTHLTLPTIYSV